MSAPYLRNMDITKVNLLILVRLVAERENIMLVDYDKHVSRIRLNEANLNKKWLRNTWPNFVCGFIYKA